MTIRPGLAIVAALGLSLAPSTARAQPGPDDGDALRNQFGTCRLEVRNLAASVRARLDEADAGAARVWEHRRKLREQRDAVSDAEMASLDAKLAAEVAEVELTAYEAGTARQELETIEGDLAQAQSELVRARMRPDWAKAHVDEVRTLLAKMGPLPKMNASDLLAEYNAGRAKVAAGGQVFAAQSEVEKAAATLEQAQVRKDVFLKFEKPKRMKLLRFNIERAKSVALREQARLIWAKDVEVRLEREGRDIDQRSLTAGERSALAKFSALEKGWREILAHRGDLDAHDAAKHAAMKARLDGFAEPLHGAARAWSAARESRLDDLDAAVMRREPQP